MTPDAAAQQETPDALSAWASEALSAMMTRHGVGSRHQAALVARVCGISVSQARRKFRGSPWLFNEVYQLCSHFNEPLAQVFCAGAPSAQSRAAIQPPDSSSGTSGSMYEASLSLGEQTLLCEIELGSQCPPPSPDAAPGKLYAAHQPGQGWQVSDATGLASLSLGGPHFEVMHLQWRLPETQARARIAVLDDDVGAAEALTDWFNEIGYEARAYHTSAELVEAGIDAHDAFVVDLILGPQETSEAVVERIRQMLPQAPIVLLTGQLRDGTASEATLTTILRTQGVTFFEKPVRPAVLTAAIQSSLDRLSATHV